MLSPIEQIVCDDLQAIGLPVEVDSVANYLRGKLEVEKGHAPYAVVAREVLAELCQQGYLVETHLGVYDLPKD